MSSKLGKQVVVTTKPVGGFSFEGEIVAVAGRFWWDTAYKVRPTDITRTTAWYSANQINFVR